MLIGVLQSERGRSIRTFVFKAGEEKWLWCSYGPFQLSTRLPDAASECSFVYVDNKREWMTGGVAVCTTRVPPHPRLSR